MGVGCYECGLGSGYNMDSEVIQDHAVVNVQNTAVTVGLAMPWAGNSSDYECSFSMGVSLSKLWLLYSQSHLVEFFDFQSFKCSSLVSYDAFQKTHVDFPYIYIQLFWTVGKSTTLQFTPQPLGEELTTFWYTQHLSDFSCTVKLWHSKFMNYSTVSK